MRLRATNRSRPPGPRRAARTNVLRATSLLVSVAAGAVRLRATDHRDVATWRQLYSITSIAALPGTRAV
ncbi:hypothetical protein ACFPM0_08580 [Pseudonocardia sulfidoxydans]|uniref:hypothetical protein n=1 Tax=Pseudonocardia sulfidoxydans TaxID=54011 RepID=UPI0036227C5B